MREELTRMPENMTRMATSKAVLLEAINHKNGDGNK